MSKDEGGPHVKGYGPVMGVATAIIALLIVVTSAFGPERRGQRFDTVHVPSVNEAEVEKDSELAGVHTGTMDKKHPLKKSDI
jgi:hypothetical protein